MDPLLEDFIDTLPVGAWVSDQHGGLVRSNATARRIWSGAGPPAPDDRDRFDAWCRQSCENVATRGWQALGTLAPGEAHIGEAVAIECFDGSTKTILHSTAPLRDAGGRMTGSIAIIQDITAFKANEARLQRREQLLLTMIDLLPVGVWATDKRGNVTLVNPAASRIWSGHAWDGEMDPTSFTGWWADSGKRVAVEDWAIVRALRQGETSHGDLIRIETLDGFQRTIINWAAPLKNERGGVAGAVAVAEDVTPMYRVQEQLRAAVGDREEILAMVAHDLRNPLGSIMVGASTANELALELPGSDKLRERLRMVLDLASQMSGMVDDLLSIAVSTGGGKVMLDIQQVAPSALIEQACDRARPSYHLNGIDLRCEAEENLPMIPADAPRIHRVLANLLDNALKYTEPPCSVVLSAKGQGPVVFSVTNSGPALSRQQRETMFQPFWQAERRHRGAGLGLSICRSIIEAHGGSIWAEAAEGQRVRVSFELPRLPPAALTPQPARADSCSLGGTRPCG
jgi:PAS domain S-box-containing protein